MVQRITPYLWFDSQAEEAAQYYVSNFANSRIVETTPGPGGSVMMVTFELEGLQFFALNGGPVFNFTEAVSFHVSCKDQTEVDELWNTLTADGGEEGQCGWLKDRYGLSWQIIPNALHEYLSDPDPERSGRAMQAMLKMTKIEIEGLRAAADGA